MRKQRKEKWYQSWWFALLMLLLGVAIGMLLPDSWLDSQSGINL